MDKNMCSLLPMMAVFFCRHLVATDATTADCSKVSDVNLSDVLPKTWANLAWDNVDIIEFNPSNRMSLSQLQKLMIEATRENVNIRFLVPGTKKYLSVTMDAKVSLVSSCEDELENVTRFVSTSRSGSMLVAFTKTNLVPGFFSHLKQLQKLTSFYLLDMERLVGFTRLGGSLGAWV